VPSRSGAPTGSPGRAPPASLASISRSDFARSVIASKSATPRWWDPLEELLRAKRLLAVLAEPLGQLRQGEVEEVARATRLPPQREYTWCEGKKYAISTCAVSGASLPCTALASIDCAKSARIGARGGLLRIGGAHQVAVLEDGVLASSTCTMTGPRS
jgi:hypothetical protein